jgi:hypothetical protein
MFMALEPHSMAWGAAQRGPDCSGERGGKVVAHGLCVPRVITEAGKGGSGGGSAPGKRDARRLKAPRTPQRGPCRWASPCFIPRANSSVSCPARGSGRSGSEPSPRRPPTKAPRANSRAATPAAGHKAERGWDEAGHTEGGGRRGARARAVLRPDGRLNARAGAQAQVREAPKPLAGPEWGKGRCWRSAARTLPARDWLPAQRPEAVAAPLWREGCVRVWSLRETMMRTSGANRVRLAQLAALEQAVCQRLGPEWQAAAAQVQKRLRQVVRARSAVECLKSVVWMPQERHRPGSQGMLDLKRRYWHCRTLRHGTRKGACP